MFRFTVWLSLVCLLWASTSFASSDPTKKGKFCDVMLAGLDPVYVTLNDLIHVRFGFDELIRIDQKAHPFATYPHSIARDPKFQVAREWSEPRTGRVHGLVRAAQVGKAKLHSVLYRRDVNKPMEILAVEEQKVEILHPPVVFYRTQPSRDLFAPLFAQESRLYDVLAERVPSPAPLEIRVGDVVALHLKFPQEQGTLMPARSMSSSLVMRELSFRESPEQTFEGESMVWYLQAIGPGKVTVAFKNELHHEDPSPIIDWMIQREIQVSP